MSKIDKTEYIIGNGRAPSWCSALLTPYSKSDGRVGYVFRGAYADFDLSIGDKLIRDDHGKIMVVRQGYTGR